MKESDEMNLFVKVRKDVRIFVEDTNSDSEHVILFIHGWPLNHNMWEYQVEYLMGLGYRCVAVDLRGYGRSDRPFDGYDYDTMASDIKQVIDAMKLKNITLIGHSMGSAIAIRYMAKYQGHNVSKLCLLASAAPSFVRTKDWYYGFTDTQIEELIKLTYNDRPSAITKIRNMTFYRYATPSTDEWFNLICLQASGWATTKSLIAFFEERLFDDLDKIKVPTLILHGVHDEICPYYFATYLNDHINDSILLKLYQSGHAAFFEEKELISDAINKFIQGHLIVPKESEEPI